MPEKEVTKNDIRKIILRKEQIKTFLLVFKPLFFIAMLFVVTITIHELMIEPITPAGQNKIVELNINKVITNRYIHQLINILETARKDNDVKAVLIIMNSPGGSPSASDELANYLIDFQKEKEIKMYVEAMAASGGYYIACAVKPIVANANAIVGSIGVVMSNFEIEGLAEKLGIKKEIFTAGKYKVPLSMFEKTSDKKKAYLEEQLLLPTYKNFLAFVSKQRGLPIGPKLDRYAEGRVFVASDPRIEGILIDSVSYLTKYKKEIKTEIANKYNLAEKDICYIEVAPKEKISLLKKILQGSIYFFEELAIKL